MKKLLSFAMILLLSVFCFSTYSNDIFAIRQIQSPNNGNWYPIICDDDGIYTTDILDGNIIFYNKINEERKEIVSSGYNMYLGINNKRLIINSMNTATGATQIKSTTDFGETWEILHSDFMINPISITYKGKDTALICALSGQSAGKIIATYDGFKTTNVLHESNSMYGYSCNPKGDVILFSNAVGDLFRSEDFGKTIAADSYFGSEKNGRINMIKQINGKVFVTTQDGKLMVSNDSADSWESLSVPGVSHYYFRSMDIDSDGNFYLTVSTDTDGKVLKSSNLIDWEIICSGDFSINNIVAVSPNKLMFGGKTGGIWVAERTSAVVEDNAKSNISVNIQGNTLIITSNEAELPIDATVNIVDINGKKLNITKLNSTNNSMELQTNHLLSKGVYLLNINGENIHLSKKIIVE